ncbi:hypothetical protein OIU78_022496, partial [Salix suchowensis]
MMASLCVCVLYIFFSHPQGLKSSDRSLFFWKSFESISFNLH